MDIEPIEYFRLLRRAQMIMTLAIEANKPEDERKTYYAPQGYRTKDGIMMHMECLNEELGRFLLKCPFPLTEGSING